jgi:sucrose phosphorylase
MTNLCNKTQLIVYPNRIGKNLKDLHEALLPFKKQIGGLHILPFFPSTVDSGFGPTTHKEVEPEYGTWEDIENLAKDFDLVADLTVNHISDQSVEFLDYVQNGQKSKYKDLFLNIADLGEISNEDLSKIHIRKSADPFLEVKHADGSKSQVWSTFNGRVDLNYETQFTIDYISDTIKFLASKGIKMLRLDALGYIDKKIGTSCYVLEPLIYERIKWFRTEAQKYGMEILVEVHTHFSFQSMFERHGAFPYGFALPPIMLYSMLFNNTKYLKNWLRMCPRNQITVLDTHDGIGVPDGEHILPKEETELFVTEAMNRAGDPILRGTAGRAFNYGTLYQIGSTYFDALRKDEDLYLAARAIQLFAPGIPQVYYVGLTADENNFEQAEETGEPREISRHYYSVKSFQEALKKDISKRILNVMEFRNTYPAFDGEFYLEYSSDSEITLSWKKDKYMCSLLVDTFKKSTKVIFVDVKTFKRREIAF